MTNSSFEPKIHLCGVKLHILTYGGLGHRPLLSEELVLFGVFTEFYCISMWFYGKHIHTWSFHLFALCNCGCEVPSQFELSNLSHSYLKDNSNSNVLKLP